MEIDYQTKLKLRKLKETLSQAIDDLNDLLSDKQLNIKYTPIPSIPDGSTSRMIFEVITKEGRFTHINKIHEKIIEIYGISSPSIASVRESIHRVSKRKQLVCIHLGGHKKYSYWGRPSWLDEYGKPLLKYQPQV